MNNKILLIIMAVCVWRMPASCADTQYWLSNVPDYYWYHGCSPTSGGTMFGYWDNQTGYEDLYDGTAPMFAGAGYQAIDEIISSTEHNAATYVNNECTHDNTPPPGDTGPNSIGCFMHTNASGGSSQWNIATGLRRYADYDDPDTATNESYDFHSLIHYTPRPTWPDYMNEAAFTFWDYKREIDFGRPVHLSCSLDAAGSGHSVVGYGYWLDDSGDYWYAVRDTWQDGDSHSTYGVTATMDSGQEWWLWDLRESGESFGEAYFVNNGRYFIPNDDGPMEETTDYGDTFDTAEPINALVETIYADLTSDDWDYYMMWMDEGDRIVAMTQDNEGYGGAIDTVMTLYNPSYTSGWQNDDFWSSTYTSHLFYEADEVGWWRIEVHGYDSGVTGDYVLEVLRQPIPEPGTVALFALGLVALGAKLRRRRTC